MNFKMRTDNGGGNVSKRSIAAATVKGLAISVSTVVVVSILLAIILSTSNWLKLGTSGLLLINYLSIAIGGVYAAKTLGSHGWVVGLSVGAAYGILAILLGGLGGAGEALSLKHGIGGFVATLLVGTVSGMIGVNLK